MQRSLRIQPCDVSYDHKQVPHIDPRIRTGFEWIVEAVIEQLKDLDSRRSTDIKEEIKEKVDRKKTMMPIFDKRKTKTRVVPELI